MTAFIRRSIDVLILPSGDLHLQGKRSPEVKENELLSFASGLVTLFYVRVEMDKLRNQNPTRTPI